MRPIVTWIVLGLTLICAPSAWAERDRAAVYFFGNSLVEHDGRAPLTSVSYWLARLARAGGKGFAADGQWGFMRDFARGTPAPQWSVPGVDSAWRGGLSGYDAVVLTPANFIQYQPADRPYDGDNPDRASPLSVARAVVERSHAAAPGARLFVYEGWAEMAGVTRRFPPSQRDLAKYHRVNGGEYHRWYLDLVQDLQAAVPGAQVRLIPVASVLAQVLSDPALSGLAATDLYTDDAPHGTPSLYFLAALVTYAALYDVAPPARMDLPDTIHPLIRDNLAGIVATVAQRTGVRLAALSTPGPALAMGLDGIHDWSTQYPFINVMKSARPWLGHVRGQWGGFEADRLEAEGYLDEHGWPMAIPEGVDKLETYVLTDLPPEAGYFAGRWRLTYAGKGDLRLGGRARNATYGDGEITFSFSPGDGPVVLALHATDPADHLRNIAVVHQDHAALHDMGFRFNPQWLALVADLRVLRFMDWMQTNGSPVRSWQDRPLPGDYSYARRGVPPEVMVELSNLIAADPWFCMPHRADDTYVEAFAGFVRQTLDPRRTVYVEYSNELWNFLFPQAKWAADKARARWHVDQDGWMQWAGMRAAQVMDIWSRAFGDADRLVRVAGVHTGWPGLEEAFLEAPLAAAEGAARPAVAFDAYAVAGYFGLEAGTGDMPAQILRWAQDGVVEDLLTAYLRHGSLQELTQKLFPYHAGVARTYGLDLIMYEGGTHLLGVDQWVEDEALTEVLTQYNYSEAMGGLYADLLAGWAAAGGTLFNAFVDVAKPSKWGSWGARRHLQDDNPRWAALMAYNAGGGVGRAGDYANGLYLRGGDSGQQIMGTPFVDVIVAGRGDDRIIAAGGGDFLVGGDGVDTVVLPGVAGDYKLAIWGETVLLQGPGAEVALQGIEGIEFESEPGARMELGL
ncbi:calcium-binding protein [Thalassovita sp.]|uniref:calcium-binding protein n=1 Tax=Thalassovita sp. TaxID=1979401 RepID=UPI0029DE5AFD|nr:calcium-binding protein [Thalassovita sp.]